MIENIITLLKSESGREAFVCFVAAIAPIAFAIREIILYKKSLKNESKDLI